MCKGAERPNIMKRFFADCSLVLGDMNELESKFDGDMDAFVSHLIVKLFDKKFAKEKGDILGSHEHAEPRHKFSLLAVQRVHGIWVKYQPRRLVPDIERLVKILRRQIRAKRGNSIPCNGGGWVNIDYIPDREDVFSQYRCRKGDRLQIIAECVRSEDRKARKPRLQILAARFDQEIDIGSIKVLIAAGWTKESIDWIRREHNGWWQPWCIEHRQDIRISDSLILLSLATYHPSH